MGLRRRHPGALPALSLALLATVACGCAATAPAEAIVQLAVASSSSSSAAADAEPFARPADPVDDSSPRPTTSASIPTADETGAPHPPQTPPPPDVGPLDRFGERPRLIRDAPPAARVELAKKLVNPISDLIRMPVQANFDEGFGPTGAHRFTWVASPFIPYRLSEDWNLISQTRIPFAHQQSPIPGLEDECGLGDISETLLLAPQSREHIWAVGATVLFPTAGHEFLGARKWAAGPTGIGVVQQGPWTLGVIASQLWSVAGDDDRRNLNVTTVAPLVGYTTKNAFTFLLEVDGTYDWDDTGQDPWTIPIGFTVSHVRRLGRNLVSVGVGARYFADAPENGPEWGMRLSVTFLFRK